MIFQSSNLTFSRRNNISCLKVGDRWLDTSSEIVEEVTRFFSTHFASIPCFRPTLDGVVFPRLSEEENSLLVAPFSMEEIEGGGVVL
jgi:hypothetical protein